MSMITWGCCSEIVAHALRKIRFRATALLLFLSFSSVLLGQSQYNGLPSLVWPKLYDIKYVKAQDQSGEYDKPIFSQAARSVEGKIVTLPGYMVPFEYGTQGNSFILTSLPLNACFFCGVGGPESVIEINLTKTVTYTEKPIEVKGILRLNDKDPDGMIYRLEQAEFLGEIEF